MIRSIVDEEMETMGASEIVSAQSLAHVKGISSPSTNLFDLPTRPLVRYILMFLAI